MTDEDLLARFDKALALDAPTASDYECSVLLAVAMDARDRLTTLLAERDAALVVELGVGKRVVNWGTYAGNPAVFIEPLPDGKPGIEGELVPDELQGPKDSLMPGAIVLSFHEYPNTFLDCLRKALNYEDALDAALAEGARLREALEKMQRSRDRYREAWNAEKAHGTERVAAALGGHDDG